MKNQFFSYWTAIIVVLILNFNLNHFVYAGDSSPKIRAEKVPAINCVGRALFGPKTEEIKAPRMDDLAKNPAPSARRYPCCKPTCAPKKPPLLTAEVPPPPPLLTAEVPPPPTLLVAEVPPVPTPELLVAEVPPAYSPELLVAEVPLPRELLTVEVPSVEHELLVAEVPPPPPPIVNYIRLPCPPEDSYRVARATDCPRGHDICTCHDRGVRFVEDRRAIVDHPVYVETPVLPVREPLCLNGDHPGFIGNPGFVNNQWQDPGFINHGFVGGHHPGFINNGLVGGHPQQFGGDNYGRAMAWGHHVVNNAYNIGYGIGTNAYDIGRSW